MKNKTVSGFLALFFGFFGVHRFYLGQRFLGVVHFMLAVFTIMISAESGLPFALLPGLIGLIDAILFFAMPKTDFDDKYNSGKYSYAQHQDGRERRRDRRTARRHRHFPPQHRQENNSYEMLKSKGIQAFRDYQFEEAAEYFEEALAIQSNDAAMHFNLACTYSIMEEASPAFFHLEEAVELGFDKYEKIHQHDALAYLRSQAIFDAFVDNGYCRPAPQLPEPEEEETLSLEPTPTPAKTASQSVLDQIVELGKLRDKGVLTQEEFAQQKQKLLE